jgi:hypothetical protein
MLREIGKKQYSKEVYSDADMLLNFNVLGAVDLNKSLTYLWGRNSNQFPLLSLTEGQGNISRKKPINAGDTQYKWKIMGKPTVTSPIVRLITPTQTPGKGFMSFKAEFQDNLISILLLLLTESTWFVCRPMVSRLLPVDISMK